MQMKPRPRPKIDRQVEDKKPQGPLPDNGKSQATWKERLGLKDQPAVRHCGEDDYFTSLESRRSRLMEALGIVDYADYAFCDGLLQQLNRLFPIDAGPQSDTDFDFVLSVLKSPKPNDKHHAMLLFQMALVQLCITRQGEILLKPINYELPYDVAVALHRANWDAGRMEPQKIKIYDQPVRQMAERMLTRLSHTFALQFQISAGYQKAAELANLQQVTANTHGAQAKTLLSDGTDAAPRKRQKDVPGRSSRALDGSQRSAAGFTDGSKEMNSMDIQKANGHASS
jgi:hypothetical protein